MGKVHTVGTDTTESGREDAPSWGTEWHTSGAPDLEATIAEFKARFPGWYYMLCECQVTCDARIAPTNQSPDIRHVRHANLFDDGFDVALDQPSTLAEALRQAMREAEEELAKVEAGGADG